MLTNWKGPDLTSYGELVLEGTFRIQRAKNERTLFLFDKLLLITKKRDEMFAYKAHILVCQRANGDVLALDFPEITPQFTVLPLFVTVWESYAC